jgi:broad specificity phosphatase PhoE
MKLYFVRHGVTGENTSEIYQTRDTPLSAEGMMQADLIAQRFKDVRIDRIVASTMLRAQQTALVIAERCQRELVLTQLLDEQRRPGEVRGRSKEDPGVKAIMQLIQQRSNDSQWHFSDEENVEDLQERAKLALEFIFAQRAESLVIVTHGELLRMILSVIVLGEAYTHALFGKVRQVFATSNTGISLIEYDDRGWYIRAWNDEAHLGELRSCPVDESLRNAA